MGGCQYTGHPETPGLLGVGGSSVFRPGLHYSWTPLPRPGPSNAPDVSGLPGFLGHYWSSLRASRVLGVLRPLFLVSLGS